MSKEIMENDMCMEACEGVTEPMVRIPVSRFEELIWSETRFCTLQTMIKEGVELPKICRVFGLDYKKTTRDRLAEAFEDAIIEKTKEKRYNSDIYSWQGEANIYHTFKDDSQLDWKACWYYSQRGLPGSVVLYNNRSEERLWDEDFFTQAIYKRRLAAHWNLQARMKYTHSWNRYEDTDVKYTDGKQVDVDRQNEYYGSATIGWNPIAILSLALAQDLSYNDLRNNINIANNSESPYPERFTSLTSLTAQLRTQRVDITGNIVATYATEKVKSGNQPDDRKRLSPSPIVCFTIRPCSSEP